MRGLRYRSPVWHALVWIGIWLVLTFAGDAVSAWIGVENSATAVVLVLLSVVLLLYLRSNSWLAYYGVRLPRRADVAHAWYYVPLAIMVVLWLAKGLKDDLSLASVGWLVVLMIGIGFLEELLFRGFLYTAILEGSTLTRAVVISSVTFGIGHGVNLARGLTGAEQLLQIVLATAVGLVLTLVFAVTGSILPGALFHTLYNISANLTGDDLRADSYVVLASIVLLALYAVPLIRQLRRRPAPEPLASAAVP